MLRVLVAIVSSFLVAEAFFAPPPVPTLCPGSFTKCHYMCRHSPSMQKCIEDCSTSYCNTPRPTSTVCSDDYRMCRRHCWHEPDVQPCMDDCKKEFCPSLPTRSPHALQKMVCHKLNSTNCLY